MNSVFEFSDEIIGYANGTALECYGMCMPEADLIGLQELVRQATAFSDSPRILEVGSWTGRSALVMSQAFLNPLADNRIYCVDHWQGSETDFTRGMAQQKGHDVFQSFIKNIGDRLMRTIIPCLGPSLYWASVWKIPLDMVFIDASHDYESVKADIEAWMPHVKPGGIICGHDYMASFPGVMQAAAELGTEDRYVEVIGKTLWYKEV